MGVPPMALGDYLELIQSFCLIHALPPLTALVVQETTGLPGPGFSASTDIAGSQAKAFAHEWLEMRTPKIEDLATAGVQLPSKGNYDRARLESILRRWVCTGG